VDYSPLERIQKDRTIHLDRASFGDRLILRSVISSRKDILKGSMVLIGDADAEKASDQVYVAVAGRHVPGVFVQACAAYTLAIAPLYALHHWWRPVVDFLLSLTVFAFVLATALYYNRSGRAIATHRLQVFSVTLMVAFVLFVGLGLVRVTRVMWDDFLLLAVALVIHSPVERFVTGTFRWLKSAVPSAWDRLIAEKEDE
jgi:CHASE2 domain-containing sensor protein